MEASALRAPAGLGRSRISVGAPLLRLRSDEQLVSLFRAGNEDAFRVIHDRYRQRLFAYTRQMLAGSRQDAEDALQDVFVRAYSALRASEKRLALRAWLYRIAHNRCIDELRRPVPAGPEVMELLSSPVGDPIAEAERRESLRQLIADLRRLPDQQRSALLMRELSGMSYAELADVLGVTVAAVKSLLVRARVGLVQAAEARDTACAQIREQLTAAHDRGVRPDGTARRHMRDCAECRTFRHQIKGSSRQLAALTPALGPLGLLAKALGLGGGLGGAVGGSGSAGSAAAAGGAASVGAGHVATLLAAAVVTAGGAIEVQRTISSASTRPVHRAGPRAPAPSAPNSVGETAAQAPGGGAQNQPPPPDAGPGTNLGSSAPSSSTPGASAAAPPASGRSKNPAAGTPTDPAAGVDGGGLNPGTGSFVPNASSEKGPPGQPAESNASSTGSGVSGVGGGKGSGSTTGTGGGSQGIGTSGRSAQTGGTLGGAPGTTGSSSLTP